MRERPILFSAPMVRAILAGTKTQTRRIVKHVKFVPEWGSAVGRVGGAWLYGSPAGLGLSHSSDNWGVVLDADHLKRMCMQEAYGWGARSGCPYGVPGDRLWVREAWTTHACFDDVRAAALTTRSLHYQADGRIQTGRNRAAMHMPRWASRITLEVTGVRVERLQDISESDAQAEGITYSERFQGYCIEMAEHFNSHDPRESYWSLWEAINGSGSVEANPWVWVVEFKRHG